MTTYEEYRQLRRDCGYSDEYGFMVEKVWDGCTPESQEDMLIQYRGPAAEARAARAQLGPKWGVWS